MKLIKIAYICVHNSCRSQMAEALTRHLYPSLLLPYSAGTETRDQINQDAVRIIKERFQIDMEILQRPKLIDELPPIDIIITMGCNVDCPYLPSKYRMDWGLEDPSGLEDSKFHETIDLIIKNIQILSEKIRNGDIIIN
jgi:arsenate reductase (thioredoxin)